MPPRGIVFAFAHPASWLAAAARMLVVAHFLVGCAVVGRLDFESSSTAEFRLHAPDAKRVAVVGTFNGWNPDAHLLRGPDGNGVWSLRLSLAPGRYRYMFVVDGVRWLRDPAALAEADDGFGQRNSVLIHGR